MSENLARNHTKRTLSNFDRSDSAFGSDATVLLYTLRDSNHEQAEWQDLSV